MTTPLARGYSGVSAVAQYAAGVALFAAIFIEGEKELSEPFRPIIGIPCRYKWETSYYELRETYADSLYEAGGTPLLIPLIPKADFIDTVVDKLDAICLSGAVGPPYSIE